MPCSYLLCCEAEWLRLRLLVQVLVESVSTPAINLEANSTTIEPAIQPLLSMRGCLLLVSNPVPILLEASWAR